MTSPMPPVPSSAEPPRPKARKRLPFWRPRRSRLSQYVALFLVLAAAVTMLTTPPADAGPGHVTHRHLVNVVNRSGLADGGRHLPLSPPAAVRASRHA